MKFSIDAVHSIFKRVVKYNLSYDEFTDLCKELLDNGYDAKDMKLKTFYEEGDNITLTEEMVNNLNKKSNFDKDWILKAFKFPIKGEVRKARFDHIRCFLEVKWDEERLIIKSWKKTNISFLIDMGFNFIQPELEEIPITECDEKYLSANEIVLKHLMIRNDWTENEAEEYLKPVKKAMSKANAVFYQP